MSIARRHRARQAAAVIRRSIAISAGFRLGVYEIVSIPGEGGMGRVYRARDTKLQRDVAIRVLPEDVVTRSERVRA